MANFRAVALTSVAILFSQQPAMRADTVNLHPVADTTLQEAFPNNNFGDGLTFQAGGRRQGGRTRGLMQFDIASAIPGGSIITSASLTLNVVATPSGGFNSIFDLNRVLAAWGQGNGSDHGGSVALAGQATWNQRMNSIASWTTPGGDFSATVSGSRSVTGNGAYTFSSTANMVGDVQSWLDSPANNFGWLLRSDSETTPTSIRRFGSLDDGALAPSLTVVYTVPEPGTAALVAAGALMLCGRTRLLGGNRTRRAPGWRN